MKITTHAASRTLALGKTIGRYAQKGDIICLYGDLGAGKTVLAKGIAAGLGIKPQEVISPTFVIFCAYRGRLPLYHCDFYRLDTARDIAELGYEDYFYDQAVTVIEWSDRLGRLLPPDHLRIDLRVSGRSDRCLRLRARGRRSVQLLKRVHEALLP